MAALHSSGGPLIVSVGGNARWIGMYTWAVQKNQQNNLAISREGILSANYLWCDADAHGAARALTKIYGEQASVAR